MSDKLNMPASTHHNWKFSGIGPDGKLYTAIGSPCNVCEINTGMHGLIRRQNLDGSNIEIVARGVRNSVGFDWHPQTKELWFTDNGPRLDRQRRSRGGAQSRRQGQRGRPLRLPLLPRQRRCGSRPSSGPTPAPA